MWGNRDDYKLTLVNGGAAIACFSIKGLTLRFYEPCDVD